MDHDETGCEVPPEGPILCINNCGFFGSAATMNMCSKCHKDLMLKQEHQSKLTASSVGNIVNESSSSNGKEHAVTGSLDLQVDSMKPKPQFLFKQPSTAAGSLDLQVDSVKPEPKFLFGQPSNASGVGKSDDTKEGPKRCSSCKKRVGLMGFNCRCGKLFCALHRYSDKHDCPFDYRTAGCDAIAKANPVVRAEKLDKI